MAPIYDAMVVGKANTIHYACVLPTTLNQMQTNWGIDIGEVNCSAVRGEMSMFDDPLYMGLIAGI